MFRKSITLLLLASTSLAAAASASAAPDSAPAVRDHRTQRPNEVVPANRNTYDCSMGSIQLWKMGYAPVVAYDCDGPAYHYTAMDGVSLFRAEMNAYTAEIEVVFVGITQ